ncbi:uncharacterized protein LOC113767495 [Coffea eugenioides]|uniref:uncharacterized protein LOC113767495 n=1 Tax=Coffea eugenioides TaxID=49369 RepID=UPI000F610083|nr:uncharacterized protein LOC113767495 [Coffea eugenioides]
MGGEGPKLYTNKPKKAQSKQHKHQQHQPSSSMASSTPPGSAAADPPLPKESFIRRNKFIWPLLLAVNFTVGAYLFMRTKKKDGVEEAEVPNVAPASVATTATTTTVTEKPLVTSPVIEPPKPREPIPENEQRELYKWMLEEKRKSKPKDPEEKKRIDEEKALLKQFIRAKSISSL